MSKLAHVLVAFITPLSYICELLLCNSYTIHSVYRPLGMNRPGNNASLFPGRFIPKGRNQLLQRSSAASWIRLPQVSFTMAMVEPVTLVGGMVNSAPAAFMRLYSCCTSST